LNPAPMSLGDPFGDPQTKSAAFHVAIVCRVTSVKPVEYTGQFLGRDAGSGVGELQFGDAIIPGQGNGHSSVRPVEFNQLSVRFSSNCRSRCRSAWSTISSHAGSSTVMLPGWASILSVRKAVPHQLIEMHGGKSKRRLAGVGLCKKGEAVDDLGEALNA
jgi:hypothetical protein